MAELELVGLHEDGEHLVLTGPDGQRFRLRIDEPLRAAVRRDRPQLEQLRAQGAGTLSPREIQARIRAGATAAEVAHDSGLPVESVQRYEGPVLAEREYVAELARGVTVGRELGAPTLGDLVTDRLATRGVDPGALSWDAAREGTSPWTVVARFRAGDETHEARWSLDTSSRALTALDDEARWLSETELDEPFGRRRLAAVRDVVFDLHAPVPPPAAGAGASAEEPPAAEPTPGERTAAMLDDLSARRGTRQRIDLDDDTEQFEGFGPQHVFDLAALDDADAPGAHPVDADPVAEARVLTVPTLRPVHAVPTVTPEGTADDEGHDDAHDDGSVDAGAAGDTDPASLAAGPANGSSARSRSRRGRAQVPSWDEIVFGAKPEA
jgi:hypothetical protein